MKWYNKIMKEEKIIFCINCERKFKIIICKKEKQEIKIEIKCIYCGHEINE